ncbi:sodium:solute symporter [Rheinheimera texasensis]|uniref:sodium:solute symporter n=1 Tax=Rheinheimera texasensis TaxID=306205 RepID=UPI000A0560C6|nr:sodium:solute symporter [Rheinheimera texasensis]
MNSAFQSADWSIFAGYFLLLALTGWWFNRGNISSSREFFTGNGKIPTWVVAVSVLATAQSAATFLGAPDYAYRGDLTYLTTNLGALAAAFFVAHFLLPKFYQYKVSTAYALLQHRFGEPTKRHAGWMYLIGRLFASGARLYMAAIALSMILFSDIAAGHVLGAIMLLCIVSFAYSTWGGIRSVIYGDAIQCAVYVGAAVLVFGYLYWQLPGDSSQIWQSLQTPADGSASKLRLLDFGTDLSPAGAFNLLSTFTGFFLLFIASFGLDQDLTQRALSCRDARQGTWALVGSVLLVVPVVMVLLGIGLLLFLFYRDPAFSSIQGAAPTSRFAGETITVFMFYVLHELPTGLRGLVTVGVIAAAVSTLTSGLNSMASVLMEDMLKPRLGARLSATNEVPLARAFMLVLMLALGAMAMLCFYWQQFSDTPLLAFALGVMVFSYSGLLAVFAVALFSQRGNTRSCALALLTGFVVAALQQPYLQKWYLPAAWQFDLAFTWQLCIGFMLAALVALSGKPQPVASRPEPPAALVMQRSDEVTDVYVSARN